MRFFMASNYTDWMEVTLNHLKVFPAPHPQSTVAIVED